MVHVAVVSSVAPCRDPSTNVCPKASVCVCVTDLDVSEFKLSNLKWIEKKEPSVLLLIM